MSSAKRQLAARLNAEAEGSGFLTKQALLKNKRERKKKTTLNLALLRKAAFSGD